MTEQEVFEKEAAKLGIDIRSYPTHYAPEHPRYQVDTTEKAWKLWQACAEIKDKEIYRLEAIIKSEASIIEKQAIEIAALRELNLDLQEQVKLLNGHIASLEYDWDVIKETITTLTHARAFITSKIISMHPDGVALYDENIETLKQLIREASE